MTRKLAGACAAFVACLVGWPSDGSAQTTNVVEVRVVVKDRSSNTLVNAAIYSRSNCPMYDPSKCYAAGVHRVQRSPSKVSCPQGAEIYARISTPGYYRQSSAGNCFSDDGPIELFVARYDATDWLTLAANGLNKEGKPNEATVLLAEAYQRNQSQDTFEETLKSAAKALGIDPKKALIRDELQKRNVASTELVDAIKKFQKEQGILVDGVLGPQTMKKLAGDRPLRDVIFEFAVQPPTKAADVKS
ncbi:MAG: peptidoglycan-binding protein [Enhydrobacter sp.]|nr:MAG: peptidoglycan-binding protein [Enhydrobacter sp.]